MQLSREQRRAAMVFGLAVTVYAGAVPSGFVFDDRPVITENAIVQGIAPLSELPVRDWFGLPAARTIGSYRPLATLAFWVDWRVSAGNPHYFHALNVLLHGLCMALVYLVFRGIVGEGTALAGALLAAVLAASSEAVEGAIGRADLFETIAIVGGMWAHRRTGRRWAVLAAVAYAVALGSKESGVLAIGAWAVVDVLVPGPPLRERWGRWLGYGAAAMLYLSFRGAALGTLRLPGTTEFYNPLVSAGIVGRVFGAAHIFVSRYLFGLLDPRRRLYDCSSAACSASDVADPIAWIGLALAVAIVAVPLVTRRRAAGLAVGVAWFGCFFLPVSNLIVPATLSYGERLLYIPGIGLCLAVGWGLSVLRGATRQVAWGLMTLYAVANVVTLQFRHLDWRDPASLYRSGLRYASNSATVLEQNAAISNQQGHFAEAEDFARRSIAIVPDRPYALPDLAVALDGQGRAAEAEQVFRRAIDITPRADVAAEYVTFLARHSRFQEAAQAVDEYVAVWPEDPSLHDLRDRVHRAISTSAGARPIRESP